MMSKIHVKIFEKCDLTLIEINVICEVPIYFKNKKKSRKKNTKKYKKIQKKNTKDKNKFFYGQTDGDTDNPKL